MKEARTMNSVNFSTTELHQGPVQGAWVCPTRLDGERLRREIVKMYERVAQAPAPGDFHFHVGSAYAANRLGYDPKALASLPASATRRFAGVGNPLAAGPIAADSTVLDHACGSATDLMLAATRLGPDGYAIGIDITPGMRAVARESVRSAGLARQVEIAAGSFEQLPVGDATVDVVISNGVLNLAPDKVLVLREVWRVLRPGGSLYLADVVLERPLSDIARANAALWAACVGGALAERDLLAVLAHTGFEQVHIAARHDPFNGTSLALKFGDGVRVSSVTLSARKPL